MKNNMKNTSITIVCFLILIVKANAQTPHNHKNDISAAVGFVPLPQENTNTVGFHLHYLKGIGDKKQWSTGIGLESIADEHGHYTISIPIQYRIIGGLTASLAPGLMLRKENDEILKQFSQHIEVGYEYDFGDIHLGPVTEVGIEPTGVHYMLGIHFGVGI